MCYFCPCFFTDLPAFQTFMKVKGFTRIFLPLLVLLSIFACKPEEVKPTLLQTLEAEARFSMFREALTITDLAKEFDGDLYYTFFVPPNTAFESYMTKKGYASLSAIPVADLKNLILYHIQLGILEAENIQTQYVLSLAGGPKDYPLVWQVVVDGSVKINNSEMTELNKRCGDGMIHVMNSVIELPSMQDLLDMNEQLSTMKELLVRGKLYDTLATEGPYTLFVANNSVFNNFFKYHPQFSKIADLSDSDAEGLASYHIMNRLLRYEDVQNNYEGKLYTTFNFDHDIKIASSDKVVFNDSISAVLLNLQATNGVIHVISDVLEY
ncbi:MAG: fasciclin domain-containing protein [Bacteroidetes bacterium]|nr:MAG: fasciclin domain-containing protein [Bacteroidota bacterium]